MCLGEAFTSSVEVIASMRELSSGEKIEVCKIRQECWRIKYFVYRRR